MLKSEEISNPNSCLSKAADNEPVFVLRGQDIFAPGLVRAWAELFKAANMTDRANARAREKYLEALFLADAMEQWPSRKMPD